jgi:hypothetical protein
MFVDTTVTVTNMGDSHVTVTAWESTSPEFSVESALPIGIPPNSSRPVAIRFTPSERGSAEGVVTLVCDSTRADLYCRGSGFSLAGIGSEGDARLRGLSTFVSGGLLIVTAASDVQSITIVDLLGRPVRLGARRDASTFLFPIGELQRGTYYVVAQRRGGNIAVPIRL